MAGWGIGFRPYSRQRESVELRKTSPVMDENIVIMLKRIGRVCRPLLAIALALTLALAPIGAVWARSGGRIGGGSFRSPTFSAPPPRLARTTQLLSTPAMEAALVFRCWCPFSGEGGVAAC